MKIEDDLIAYAVFMITVGIVGISAVFMSFILCYKGN